MNWSPQQSQAIDQVHRWHQSGGEDTFRLFGYAGSGKTTLAKHFAEGVNGSVIYCAFTGKAASVLRQKGCQDASTIHKLIYKPAEKSKERLQKLHQELTDLEEHLRSLGQKDPEIDANRDVVKLREAVDLEVASHRRLSFQLNEESDISHAALVVIDECSMVDEQIGHDLESFGVPILVLGDPAQLPPVFGAGYFTERKPDCLLTEIHRQAKGNPILELATDVRNGRGLRKGRYGDSEVIGWGDVDRNRVMAADQLLVGTNKRRHEFNDRLRELKGFQPGMPTVNDRLVCLRNNHELGLLNGGLWGVQDSVVIDEHGVELTIKADDSDLCLSVSAHSQYFLGKEPPFWNVKEKECFDYGYALTVHKSQGSQWDNVYIFDESRCFRADAQRWLYTAITRAAKQVTVVVD